MTHTMQRIMGLESELHATREEKEKMYFEHMHSQGEHLNILNTKLAAVLYKNVWCFQYLILVFHLQLDVGWEYEGSV